jgi:phage baseplate assembly protein W
MATAPDAVTNLTGTWQPGVGITLNWTAPASSGSSPLYYYIVEYSLTPREHAATPWTKLLIINRKAYRLTTSPNFALNEPVTTANFAFPVTNYYDSVTQEYYDYIVYTFRVYSVNNEQIESNFTYVTVLPPDPESTFMPQHLDNSFQIDAFGDLRTNDQDSYEDIANSVAMFLGTTRGSRSIAPDYGVPDPTFTLIDNHAMEEDLKNWEPRADTTITVTYDDANEASISAIIDVNNGGVQ